MAEQAKPWWQSKTIWANVGAVAAAGVAAATGEVTPKGAAIAGVMAAGNVILRLITTQPVGTRQTP